MMRKRKGGFFQETPRPEDDLARQAEVAALLGSRRTVIQEIGIERVSPNPFQARKTFQGLEELAQAIQAQGFTSRLRVRPHPNQHGYFQLVYGERRLRAAEIAGLDTVPCEVAEHSDDDLIEIGLAENIQRQDLDPLEEAQAFQTFIAERGYSIRRLAERIGKDKSYIEERLALLRTPDDVQALVAQRPDSIRAAREIAKVAEPAARAPLIAGVAAGDLTTQDVRAIVQEVKAAPQAAQRIVAEQVAARSKPAAGSSPARALERDAQTLRALLDRWETLLPALDETGRMQLIATIDELLRRLEQITARLQPELSPSD
jgi:ParB family transcriptional regulator, chromosome partitioning protein